MSNFRLTAAAALRAFAVEGLRHSIPIEQVLPQFVADKGYSPAVVTELSHQGFFGSMITSLYLREANHDEGGNIGLLNHFGGRIRNLPPFGDFAVHYTAEPQQNVDIDRVLTAVKQSPSRFTGEGAASYADFDYINLPRDYFNVPIAIIGYGPAGIMIRYALAQLGFRNIVVIENRKKFGIWSQPNVVEGSRNNPRAVQFGDKTTLEKAPGDGRGVVNFLSSLVFGIESESYVNRVLPSDLGHQVFLKGSSEPFQYPIVINAVGVGKPVPISDPSRMLGPDERVPAFRWQLPSLKEADVAGKKFVFIGLGNSTAEMLAQIHKFQDQGVDVDYRVVTHYPQDAVHNPSQSVEAKGKVFRVFRDLNRPQLTSFQGDLEGSRTDYYRALYGNRIISDVRKWDVRDGKFGVWTGKKRSGSPLEEFEADSIYALVGYRHPPEFVESMGCSYDTELRCARHDYDGEFVKTPGATGGDRVHKGYFGFGAVLNAPHNRNSTVIPGMAFRLPDILFGIIMRAGECQERSLKYIRREVMSLRRYHYCNNRNLTTENTMLSNNGRLERAAQPPLVGSLPEFPGIIAAMMITSNLEVHLRGLAQTLMVEPFPGSTLSRAEREIVATFVSTKNSCYFCADSHGAFASALLAEMGVGQDSIDATVAAVKNEECQGLDPKLQALLAVAGCVAEHPLMLCREDEIDPAIEAGASDGDIQLTILIASAFSMYNRMVDGLRAKTPDTPFAFAERAKEIAQHGYVGPQRVSASQ
ncbi:MAG: hypothetical protein V4436_01325 [Patescibacteria group bacterium]